MKKHSRTANAVCNTAIASICQMAYLVLSFVSRTAFTNFLGAEYLGINGLFSNILTLLSFAELGIGSALVYRMYAPLAAGDTNKITLYLNLYKKIYHIIIVVIMAAGLSVIPFLGDLVEAPDVKENVVLLYVLYLADTVISYTYVYKKSVVIADQRSYAVSIVTQLFNIIMNIAQIIGLYLTHNFVVYCIIRSICTLLGNAACSIYADRRYPYIQKPAEGKLEKGEIKGLKTDARGLLLTKIASTAFSGTDNIFISAFIGIKYVGILSNYTMLLEAVNSVLNRAFDSITASIGNLALRKDESKTETVLNRLFFMNTGIYGYLCLGMLFLIREFVTKIWFTEEYALSEPLIFLIIFELFLRSIHRPLYTVRTAMGAFSQHKIIFAFSAFLNIVLDFIFVKPLGMCGLYLATILCRGITYAVDARVVYYERFHKSTLCYGALIVKWLSFLTANGVILYFLLRRVPFSGLTGFVLKILVTTVIYVMMFLLVYGKSEEFKYYLQLFQSIFWRKPEVHK